MSKTQVFSWCTKVSSREMLLISNLCLPIFFLDSYLFLFSFPTPFVFSFLFDYSLSSSLCCLLNKSNFCKFKAVHKIAWEYLKKKEIKGCAPHLAHCQSHFFTQKILLKLLCYLNINFFKFLNVMLPILMCR